METLKHSSVRGVTKATFPVGEIVTVEAFIDREAGWEFDAPLHFIAPFHRYYETGSIGVESVRAHLEDILIDLDCGIDLRPCDHPWPYAPEELTRIISRVRSGHDRKRFAYYRVNVLVDNWTEGDKDVEFLIK